MPVPDSDPIVVAPSPTPFTEDDRIDFGAIESNVARWLETPLSGFVLNSENGEEAFLNEGERIQIVRTVHAARSGQKLLIAAVDSPSVTETIRQSEWLVEAGAEMIRIRIPRLGGDVRGYFEQVVPKIPVPVIVIHQMAPGQFAGGSAPVGAPEEVIGEIVSMDNVFGYIASGNIRFESRVRTFIPDTRRFWIGNGVLLLPGGAIGANGACLMFGNVGPRECIEILTLCANGELSAAQEIQRRILEADTQILARGAAGIKAALNEMGFDAGVPRRPSTPVDEAGRKLIRDALSSTGLI